MSRPDGGIVSADPIRTAAAQRGVWSLRDVAELVRSGRWLAADENAASVTALLHMDGNNLTTGVLDSSASNLAMRCRGTAVISTTQSKFGGSSLSLDGSSAYLTGPTGAATQFSGDFTVELWAYINANKPINQFNLLFDTRATIGTANGFALAQDSSGRIGVFTNNAFAITGSAIAITTWHHVALTRSGTTLTLWVNGSSQGTATNSANLSDGRFAVGVSIPDTLNFANAFIDEVRVTKGIARYTASFTPSTVAL
jgi:hypothetical protein